MQLNIRNQICHLTAKRAVFWENKKTLILADIHLGKTDYFQKSGINIPSGTTANDLLNFKSLIDEFQPQKCIVVGDLIHARNGLTDTIIEFFANFLKQNTVEIHLVLGNHDAPLIKNIPVSWPLFLHKNFLLIDPFLFSHNPVVNKPWFTWSGHIHPKVEIKKGFDRIVLRCFYVENDSAILPAFSDFTGGAFVYKTQKADIYAIANSSIIKI